VKVQVLFSVPLDGLKSTKNIKNPQVI